MEPLLLAGDLFCFYPLNHGLINHFVQLKIHGGFCYYIIHSPNSIERGSHVAGSYWCHTSDSFHEPAREFVQTQYLWKREGGRTVSLIFVSGTGEGTALVVRARGLAGRTLGV